MRISRKNVWEEVTTSDSVSARLLKNNKEVSDGRDYMSSLRVHIPRIRRIIECGVLMTDAFIKCLFRHHLFQAYFKATI